jgi:ATP/maltotriose-dependent transcriptional regulator MalT
MLEELGLDVEGALLDVEAWRIEMLANDPSTAERELRRAYNTLRSVGEKFILSTVSVLLAQTQYLLGDLAEADRLVALTEELASEDDIDAQAQRRSARAKLLVLDGEPERAEALAREALDLLAPTDAVLLKFGALADLAEVYRLSGREDEALAALEDARQLAEEKRSSAFVDAAQRLVEALRAHSAVDSGR